MTVDKPKLILFDLDGTLADTIDLIVRSFQQATQTVLGWVPDDETCKSWIGQGLRAIFAQVDEERADELVAAYREWNNAKHDELIKPFPGVKTLLQSIVDSGTEVGVVTSKINWLAERSVECVGLSGLIGVTVGSDDTDVHKPDPAPLVFAMAKHGFSPEDTVYVGDATFDMEAAKAAGSHAVGVTWGACSREELLQAGADVIVDTIEELASVLLK